MPVNYPAERELMVRHHLAERGISDPRVLDAFRAVAREDFLPDDLRGRAYEDRALPFLLDQTCSQPYVVARMIELLALPEHAHVLELGTGAGYQTALLAHIADHVYGIEWFRELAELTSRNLHGLGFDHVHLQHGDGLKGWPDPQILFDGILLSFAVPDVPRVLLDSLAPHGRLVAPVGNDDIQNIRLYVRMADGSFDITDHDKVRFVHRQEGDPTDRVEGG